MEHLVVDNLKVAYRECNKNRKKTIFFLHGNSNSSLHWETQLNDPGLNNYRLIAFDLPAHGNSDPFKDGEYSLKKLGEFVAKVIKQLSGKDSYILVGISLGSNVIAEALGHGLSPKGITLASPCLLSSSIALSSIALPGTNWYVNFTDGTRTEEVRTYANQAIFKKYNSHIDDFINDYNKVKDNFRTKLYESINSRDSNDEISLLNSQNIPLLIIFGMDDYVINTHYLDKAKLNLWRNKPCYLNDASHFVNLDAPDMFNGILTIYADEMLM